MAAICDQRAIGRIVVSVGRGGGDGESFKCATECCGIVEGNRRQITLDRTYHRRVIPRHSKRMAKSEVR